MRTCRAVAGCVVVLFLEALLIDRTEGHITFFSPKEMMRMKERDGRREMELRLEDPQSEQVQQLPRVERGGNPDKTVELAVRLSPKKLDHVAPGLEKIIREIVEGNQKA